MDREPTDPLLPAARSLCCIRFRDARRALADPRAGRRVAAVTGGLVGIGAGIVAALARRAFDVVVCDRSIDPTAAEALTAEVASDARLSFVSGDLADLHDHPSLVEAVFAAFGRLDCLVSNAGVSVEARGDLFDVSPASCDLNFAVNLRRVLPDAGGLPADAAGAERP